MQNVQALLERMDAQHLFRWRLVSRIVDHDRGIECVVQEDTTLKVRRETTYNSNESHGAPSTNIKYTILG